MNTEQTNKHVFTYIGIFQLFATIMYITPWSDDFLSDVEVFTEIIYVLYHLETFTRMCSTEMLFENISQYSQEKTMHWGPLLS